MAALAEFRPRWCRIAAIAFLMVAFAPITWLRAEPPDIRDAPLWITRVQSDLPDRGAGLHGLRREGIWRLWSEHGDFGGYSAILLLKDRIRLFSDRGNRLTMSLPDEPGPIASKFAAVWNRGYLSGFYPDIESATRDPVSGKYWLGFESQNSLLRYDRASNLEAATRPPDWRNWPSNRGPEAMTRLADGRFIVLPENNGDGLLYRIDPVEGGQPVLFRAVLPDSFRPTDMATLPDGRVILLVRRMAVAYPPFTARLLLGDPEEIRAGEEWVLDELADLDAIVPRENYEGLAIAAQPDGRLALWLVSDDNLAVAIQRTLLVKLTWNPADAP